MDNSSSTVIVLSWAELSLFRVAITGITLISILSGFGVVHTPYYNLSIFRKYVLYVYYYYCCCLVYSLGIE